jgi:pimeloyl-ACP methyl ester carboxylesterase
LAAQAGTPCPRGPEILMHFADISALHAQPTVVLLHSSGANARQWSALSAALASRYNVMAPDFYGHGDAPWWTPARPMTLADEAARIGALLAHVHGPVHLVGHSYGGAVALALALQRPRAFRSVTVYEPVLFSLLLHYSPRSPELCAAQHVAERMRRHLAHSRFDLAAEGFVDFWSAPGTWAGMGPARQQAVAVRMPAVVAHFDALFALSLRVQDLLALRLPVQLLSGTTTRPVARRVVELLQFGLPDVQVHQVDHLGHMGPVVAPHRINPRITAWLDAHSAPQTGSSANAAGWQQVA